MKNLQTKTLITTKPFFMMNRNGHIPHRSNQKANWYGQKDVINIILIKGRESSKSRTETTKKAERNLH